MDLGVGRDIEGVAVVAADDLSQHRRAVGDVAGVDPGARPETLGLDAFAALARVLGAEA